LPTALPLEYNIAYKIDIGTYILLISYKDPLNSGVIAFRRPRFFVLISAISRIDYKKVGLNIISAK
jgi:hypothetical protein